MKFLALFLLTMLIPLTGHSLSILNIKGNRVLLDLEGEDIQSGDRLVAISPSGKEKGHIQIKQVKGSKAIASILKGKVEVGFTIETTESTQKKNDPEQELDLTENMKANKKLSKKKTRNKKSAWGVVIGMASNNMTVKPGNTTSTELNGTSTNFTGFYQRELDSSIGARILGGSYNLVANGESKNISACTPGGCVVEISYLGIEALVQYSIIKNSTTNLWLGAGMGFLFASGKSSNILDTSKISSNQTFIAALGFDLNINQSLFLPLQIDYVLFPDNSSSATKQTILRFGLGGRF